MNIKNKFNRTTGLCLCLLILTSCRAPLKVSTETPEMTRTEMATQTIPRPTFSPTVTLPPPTPTRTVTRTPKTTATPVATPLPTLSQQETQSLLKKLYADNTGCRLPCWWGFQPGSTTWESASRFLAQFARIYSYDPVGDVMSSYVYIPTEDEKVYPSPRIQTYIIKRGIIESIELNIVNLEAYSHLVRMVRTYGKPDEIWVSTGTGGPHPENETTFTLVIFYPQQGIMATYYDYSAEITKTEIVGCLHLWLGNHMVLWNPKKEITILEALNEYQVPFDKGPLLPLEEATGISVESYYQKILISDEPACLKTPIELWP